MPQDQQLYTFQSKFLMTQEIDKNEVRESPQRFFELLQAGDLAFLELIEYAYVIFGITKHGKTTLSHHLVNNFLKAYLNDRRQVHYRLETNKLSDAKIGLKMQSQTQIPNRFQTPLKVGQNTLYVIDNPGQLDSFGINRVLSNAYFHYRVFSKVKNMKFVLVFDSNTFSNNLKETNAIFKLFFQSFVNFHEVSDQMLKSIAIIFTKVNRNKSLGDIYQQISAYESTFNKVRAFTKQEMQFLSKLFKQCKSKSKIKLFFQADLNIQVGKCTLLQQLDQKMQYFSRKTDESQKLNSLYFNEKRVQMNRIKFSQSKTVLRLAVDQFEKQQINNLFKELSQRGYKIFQSFFTFLQQLFQFLFLDYDNCQNIERSIDRTQVLRMSRHKKSRDILLTLQKHPIQYDMQQKYNKNRQMIINKYNQKLSKSTKLQTPIDRLDLSLKIQQFCSMYQLEDRFINRQPEQILACKQNIQKIFYKISEAYHNSQQIDILSRFLYNINTFMNQLVIFCKIILPNEKEGKQKLKNFLTLPPFDKFLICLSKFHDLASQANQIIIQIMSQGFKLQKQQFLNMDTSQMITLYMSQRPQLLTGNLQNSELLLQKLSKMILSEQTKIDCVTLMFNSMKQNFLTFMHFKKIVYRNKKIGSQLIPQQFFNPKDIKKMILSFINLLKQLRKVKDLFCYQKFEKYRIPISQKSTICWNYIIKLFMLLIEYGHNQEKIRKSQEQQPQKYPIIKSQQRLSRATSPSNRSRKQLLSPRNDSKQKMSLNENISQQQAIEYQEIIIQILSKYQNSGLVQEFLNKLINLHQENFDSITLQNCTRQINSKYGKNLQGYETQCLVMFEEEKKKCAQKIINILIKYASILNEQYLKDKALQKCYKATKYTEYYPQKMDQIQNEIQQIRIHNRLGGQWVNQLQDNSKINQFQPSLTVKRKLTKFTLENANYGVLDCTKIDFYA